MHEYPAEDFPLECGECALRSKGTQSVMNPIETISISLAVSLITLHLGRDVTSFFDAGKEPALYSQNPRQHLWNTPTSPRPPCASAPLRSTSKRSNCANMVCASGCPSSPSRFLPSSLKNPERLSPAMRFGTAYGRGIPSSILITG